MKKKYTYEIREQMEIKRKLRKKGVLRDIIDASKRTCSKMYYNMNVTIYVQSKDPRYNHVT